MGIYWQALSPLRPAPVFGGVGPSGKARETNPFQASFDEVPRLQVSEILEAFTRPADRKVMAGEFESYRGRLRNFKAQILSETCPHPGPIPFVEWGHYQSGSWDQPLATAGMFSCSTLIAIDPERKQQWMGHIFPFSNRKQVNKALQTFLYGASDKLQLVAVPGILDDFWRSMDCIREGLRSVNPKLVQRMTYAGVDPDQDIPGVILWQGKLYRYALTQAPPPNRILSDYGVKDYLKPQPILNLSG